MHRDAAYALLEELDFSRVDAGPDLEPLTRRRRDNRLRAADRPRGAVERRQEAVSRAVYLASAKLIEMAANTRVMPFEEFTPALVPELGCKPGRVDNVGEQHGEQDVVRRANRRRHQ